MHPIGYKDKAIIDPKVYNLNQEFRLLGSQRPKSISTDYRKPRDPHIYTPIDNFLSYMLDLHLDPVYYILLFDMILYYLGLLMIIILLVLSKYIQIQRILDVMLPIKIT